jgi:isopenicillin-N N-acyltransferase like protein
MQTAIECEGSGRARGQAHGEAARSLIHDALQRWADAIRSVTGGSADDYTERFLGRTSFGRTVREYSPDLWAEVGGIAEAANVDRRLLLAYNLMDEQWWDVASAAIGCSVACITPTARDGAANAAPTILAQNMDLPRYLDGGQVILHLRPDRGPEALVLTAAGLIGLTGVTRTGLGVCVNALLMLPHSTRNLPVAFVLREVLRRDCVADAAAFLRAVPHASGQHYALADRGGAVGLECSCASVAEVPPADGVLVHTNHPLAAARAVCSGESRPAPASRASSSERRLAFLQNACHCGSSLADVKRFLADRTVPMSVSATEPLGTLTFGAIAIEFPDSDPRVEFCLGRPDETAWRQMTWSSATAGAGTGETTWRP